MVAEAGSCMTADREHIRSMVTKTMLAALLTRQSASPLLTSLLSSECLKCKFVRQSIRELVNESVSSTTQSYTSNTVIPMCSQECCCLDKTCVLFHRKSPRFTEYLACLF